MQDRFKFKIWDKTEKKFLPLNSKTENTDFWISIDNTGVYLVERDNARDVAFFTDITEDVIILQCTGLSDKNGKEIYDKDIIKISEIKFLVNINLLNISLTNILNGDTIIINNVRIFNDSEVIGNKFECNTKI